MPSFTFELTVEMQDGETYQVVADQRDFVRWERSPDGFPIVSIQTQLSMVMMRFLAWSAASRQGITTLPWKRWDAECVEAMVTDDEDGQPAAADDAEDPGQPDR